MEVNIAVCDDEGEVHKELAGRFADFFGKIDQRYQVAYYIDPVNFARNIIADKETDIVFLDIDMPGMNGFDVAAKIREARGDGIILIFLTSMESNVYDSFAYQPFRFIRKVRVDAELEEALTAALERLRLRKDQETITVRSDYDYIRLYLKDICYLEYVNRKIECHMRSGDVYYITNTMKALYEMLDHKDFKWAHSGGIVNLQYIKKIEKDTILMDNEARLPISRSKKEQLKKDFLTYWGAKI